MTDKELLELAAAKALLREVIRWPFVTTELATRIRAALSDQQTASDPGKES